MYYAGVAQLVEHLPSKQDVESSRLFARSRTFQLITGYCDPQDEKCCDTGL